MQYALVCRRRRSIYGQAGFTCHSCVGAAFGLSIYGAAIAPYLLGELKGPGNPPQAFTVLLLLAFGAWAYFISGKIATEAVILLVLVGWGAAVGINYLLYFFGVDGGGWYRLYALSLCPPAMLGAGMFAGWILDRIQISKRSRAPG